MSEQYTIQERSFGQVSDWILNRGGVHVWQNVNLSRDIGTILTPVNDADGNPVGSPGGTGSEPIRKITDPAEIDVITVQEVGRFHVAVRLGSQGFSYKVTDGGTRRIRQAVAKATEAFGNAWYEFDYDDYKNAVILAEGLRKNMAELLANATPKA